MQIIPLSEWYPAAHNRWQVRRKVAWSDRTHWVHHHTVGGVDDDPLTYARQVVDQHWAEWRVPGGYGFLVGTDGILREMCGFDWQGVHAGTTEWNRKGIGLAYQGDFRTDPPSDVMFVAARELIAAHPLDQTFHRAVRPTPTTCPGDALIRLLPLETDMPTTDEIWGYPSLTDGVHMQLAVDRTMRLVQALYVQEVAGDTLDAEAIAAAVVERLPGDMARQVADEIARRLES